MTVYVFYSYRLRTFVERLAQKNKKFRYFELLGLSYMVSEMKALIFSYIFLTVCGNCAMTYLGKFKKVVYVIKKLPMKKQIPKPILQVNFYNVQT